METRAPLRAQAMTKLGPKSDSSLDAAPKTTSLDDEVSSAEDRAGVFSHLVFGWVWPFLQDAFSITKRSHLQLTDLHPISKRERLSDKTEALKKIWAQQQQTPEPSFAAAVYTMLRRSLVVSFLIVGIVSGLFISTPVMMAEVIRTINFHNDIWIGYLFVGLIVLATALGSMLNQGAFHWSSVHSRQMWLAITRMIFEKPGTIRRSEMGGEITEGYCMNMISMDASQLMMISSFWTLIASCPWILVLSSGLLLWKLEESALTGIGIILIASLCAERLANEVKICTGLKHKLADQRGTLLNESMQGIRTVKLYAWESVVERNVSAVREQELRVLKRLLILQAMQTVVCTSFPTIAVLATFLVYSIDHKLAQSLVFECVALFEAMGQGAQLVPIVLTTYRQCAVNFARIQRLLDVPELYVPPKSRTDMGGSVVEITGPARFSWVQEQDMCTVHWALENVTLSAQPGQLIAIVGEVGCGKSTLVSGILGLLNCEQGSVNLNGRMAYVPQVATILNATVRDNILFGAPFDERRYAKVLEVCCLAEDMHQFPDGDSTEIGEKGITISGGQRQRIAVARAAYNITDGVVLDDALSAMDAHVGGVVFEQCLRGLMKERAVIFATNQLAFCNRCDYIYVLHEGRMVQQGTFKELSTQEGQFAQLMTHVAGGRPDQGEEELEPAPPEECQAPVSPEVKAQGGKRKLFTAEDKEYESATIKAAIEVCKSADSMGLFALMIVTTLAAPAAQYATNLTLAQWASNVDQDKAHYSLFVYVAMVAVFTLLQMLRGYVFAAFFTKASRTLFRKMLACVLRQQMLWYDTTPLGRILNRFSGDMTMIEIAMSRLFDSWSNVFGSIMTIFALTCILVPPVIVIVAIALYALSFLYKRYSAVACELQNLTMVATSPLVGALGSLLNALDTIRIFGRLQFFIDQFKAGQEQLCACYYWNWSLDRFVMCWAVSFGVSGFIGATGVILLLARDSFITSDGKGAVVLAMLTILAYRTPTAIFASVQLQRYLSAPQRVAEYSEMETEEEGLGDLRTDGWDGGDGSISFQNVSMRYKAELPFVLENVSFEIAPGTKCGLVGRTGAGKSSVILCAFRMVMEPNVSGRIVIGGTDISTIAPTAVRHGLGMIPQDAWMFSGTVRSNLDPTCSYSDQQLHDALALVGIADGGLDRQVSEKGSNFSVGTVQLLCLARVLLKHPKIIFMDEATASVDMRTDAAVQATIRKAFSECTIVTIAHRLQTIIDYDQVIVMDKGRVAEQGSPAQLLLNHDGLFSQLIANTGRASAAELRSRAAASSSGLKHSMEMSSVVASKHSGAPPC